DTPGGIAVAPGGAEHVSHELGRAQWRFGIGNEVQGLRQRLVLAVLLERLQAALAAPLCLRQFKQGALLLQLVRNLAYLHAEVLGEQPMEYLADAGLVIFRGSAYQKIAFGIHSHGAIVQVRGANAQKEIVDDHQLRMYHHGRMLCSRSDPWVEKFHASLNSL